MKKILSIILTLVLILSSLVGCSVKSDNNITLKEGITLQSIVDKINEDIGMSMSEPIDDTLLADIYEISKDDIVDYAGAMSMAMNSADTLIIVEAKKGKVNTIKKALEERQQTIINSQYLPAEIEKAKASKIYVKGNYVALIVVGDSTVKDFNSEFAQSEISKAEEIINSFFEKL